MDNIVGAKFSKRLLAFIVDMLIVGVLMQLLMVVLKTPYENWFHIESLRNSYYEMGVSMGVFDSSYNVISGISTALQEEFLAASKDIVDQYNKANLYVNMINGLVSGTLIFFVVPLIAGKGRSIGKLITKLKVVKKDGSDIGFLQNFLRGFVGLTLIEFVLSMPIMFLPFTISACLVLASPSRRALHDFVSGTTCVYLEGFEPVAKQNKEVAKPDPFHKSTKGFEYIDIEALEKREQESRERMAKQQQKNNETNLENKDK